MKVLRISVRVIETIPLLIFLAFVVDGPVVMLAPLFLIPIGIFSADIDR